MGYRLDIQGLRALAVIFVFLFHLNHNFLPGGFIGVDIFFVVSGFLISSITLHKLKKNEFSFTDFYTKRIKRIVPAYYFMLAIVMLLGAWVFIPSDLGKFKSSVLQTLLFNSNNYFASLDDYFGAKSTEFPLLHTWSLAIEMQFYLLLPIFLFLIKRKFLLPVIMILIFTLSIYAQLNIAQWNNKQSMYFSLIARIPEFLTGTVFAILIQQKFLKSLINHSTSLALIGFFAILLTAIIINESSLFPGFSALVPCIGTGLILISGDNFITKILSTKVFVFIGELSYSIYLWHWPVIALLRYYKSEYYFTIPEILIIVFLTGLISYLTYKFVEVPLRTQRTKPFTIRVGLIVFCIAVVFSMINSVNERIFNIPPDFSNPTVGLNSHGSTFKNIEVLGSQNNSNDSIMLIGDSHALVYKPFMDYIGKKNNFNFRTVTNDSYPVIPYLDRNDFPNEERYNQYKILTNEMKQELSRTKYIFFSSLYSEKVPSVTQALIKFIKKDLTKNQKLIILEDFPSLSKNPIRINRSFLRTSDEKIAIIPNTLPKTIKELPSKTTNIHILHLNFNSLSNNVPYKNDTVMYYDENHFNSFGAINAAKANENLFMKQFIEISKMK